MAFLSVFVIFAAARANQSQTSGAPHGHLYISELFALDVELPQYRFVTIGFNFARFGSYYCSSLMPASIHAEAAQL